MSMSKTTPECSELRAKTNSAGDSSLFGRNSAFERNKQALLGMTHNTAGGSPPKSLSDRISQHYQGRDVIVRHVEAILLCPLCMNERIVPGKGYCTRHAI